MKTIFITIYDAAIVKNILRTDVFRVLGSKLKIVLLVRPKKKDYYAKEFGGPNVLVEPMPDLSPWHKFGDIFYQVCLNSVNTNTVKIRQVHALKNDGDYVSYFIKRILRLLGQFKPWRVFLRSIYWLLPENRFSNPLERYRPDLVFTPNMISVEDSQLLKEAKKRRIKTVGMIKSWDNLTAKTFILVKPDKLIVHNDIVKKEAEALCDYPEKDIFVSGVPQWDIYFDKSIYTTREEFFGRIGADPKKKLTLFCGAGDDFNPTESEVLKMLDDAIESGEINPPCQVLVRPHPKYPGIDEVAKKCKHAILDRPGKYNQGVLTSWEFEKDDIVHLANSLYHSDLVINTASTMTIEAAIFDKPVICIAFDGGQKKDFYQSVERFYSYTHYQNIMKTGGIRLVRNENELIGAINLYLPNPKLNTEGRGKIGMEQAYKLDGKSGERIANFILSLL